MPTLWSRSEKGLLLAVAGLFLMALFGPFVPQPAHSHDFADQRLLAGIPCALDVLSNLPFALAGMIGLRALRRLAPVPAGAAQWAQPGPLHPSRRRPGFAVEEVQRAAAFTFFAGLLLTAAASAAYHLAPGDTGLALDRAAMAVDFAGLLGVFVAGRVSARAGAIFGAALLVLAPLGVGVWHHTGNVLPWAVVQFGGMALLLALLATTQAGPGAWPVRWLLTIGLYAAAKLFEVADHAVFAATGELLSGHTVKHVVAALAAWPLIAAVADQAQRQNGRQPAGLVA